MIARCKFVVESVTHHAYGGRTVTLGTHYDEKLSKDAEEDAPEDSWTGWARQQGAGRGLWSVEPRDK